MEDSVDLRDLLSIGTYLALWAVIVGVGLLLIGAAFDGRVLDRLILLLFGASLTLLGVLEIDRGWCSLSADHDCYRCWLESRKWRGER